jgi:histidinol dehydrogenase
VFSDINIWNDLAETAKADILRRPASENDQSVYDTVKQIIAAVRDEGDKAVKAFTSDIDGVELDSMLVGPAEFAWAQRQLSKAQTAAIDMAIANVRRFHAAQLPAPIAVETMPGIQCERISHAIESVGLYVPAGSAPLPSTAIMLSVPAAISGCPTRILCTPPRQDGRADPAVLVAAARSGTDVVYKVGGAQAIAAMAYGTREIPKVDKIFGPGNTWVTAAKTVVASDPLGAAIDMPAGPSEVLVIADASANAAFVAADLLSQAEHGADSQVLLLTTSASLAKSVATEVAAQLRVLNRKAIAADALSGSFIIVVDTLAEAVAVSNRYAPEHLIIQTATPRDLLADIRNAGSIFLGPWSPEAAGDYCSGTNHVLPTYGHATSYSGLSVDQFMRQTTVQELTRDGLQTIASSIEQLAKLEGLDAHANAVKVRLNEPGLTL